MLTINLVLTESVAALVLYVVLACEFLLRYTFDNPFNRDGETMVARHKTDKNTKLMLLALILEAIFLFVR